MKRIRLLLFCLAAGLLVGVFSVGCNKNPVVESVFGIAPDASGASALSGISISPSTFLAAGKATITLTMTSRNGGIRYVTLKSSSAAVKVPTSCGVWTNDSSDVCNQQAVISAVTTPQTVTITASYAGVSKTATLQLGSGTPPPPTYILTPSATSLAFGSVTDGTTASQTLTLKNTGTGTVNISGESLSGTGFNDTGLAGVTSIAPGGSVTVTVTFSPTLAGAFTGSIGVTSNASAVSIALSGTGVAVQPPPIVVPKAVSCATNPATGPFSDACTVTLNAAPGSAVTVTLTSSSPSVTVPASISIPAGQAAEGFTANALTVTAATPAVLSASLNGTTVTDTLTDNPASSGGCGAFAPVDVFLNMDGPTPGTTVSTANLDSATEGVSVSWSTATSQETFAASQVALPGSISINGLSTHPCGYATQALAVNEAASKPTSQINFPSGHTQVVEQALIANLPPDQGANGDLFDYAVTPGATGAGAGVVDIQPGTGLSCGHYAMDLESYSYTGPNQATTRSSPCLLVTPSSTVFYSQYINFSATGNCNGTDSGNVPAPCEALRAYTVSGGVFTQVGNGTAIKLNGTDTLSYTLLGNNENATFAGTSDFQWAMWDYTNAKWPNLPTALTVSKTGTGNGTLGCSSGTYTAGTVVACTETPASGSTFGGWSGACSGTGACSFSLTANSTVTATFNATVTPPPAGALWSGILQPVGSTFGAANVANPFGILWQGNVGLPGGATAFSAGAIQCGSTLAAGANQSTINAALAACGGTAAQQKYVLLAAGTFPVTGTVKVPSWTELRGTQTAAGTASILQSNSGSYDTCEPYTSGDTCVVALGESSGLSYSPVSITSGATAGSTSIGLSSTSGMTVGGLLAISETNASWVSSNGDEGPCNWCDGGFTSNGSRAREQVVRITAISGNTVSIAAPGLYSPYANTPTAVYFTPADQYAGLRDVQIYAGNVGLGADVVIAKCAFCYVKGVEGNYADGNWVTVSDSYRFEIRDSDFSGTFDHGAGTFDGDVDLSVRATLGLVENNIMLRGHNSLMVQWGANGNVIGYNYGLSGFDNSGYNSTYGGFNMHGADPQFNLFEGNVIPTYKLDGVWGGSSMNIAFRNWIQQTSDVCTPYQTNGRVAVTTPCFQSPYQDVGEQLDHLSVYSNSIDNVIGSAQQIALKETDTMLAAWPASRNMFGSLGWGYTFGYGDDADDGSGNGCDGGTNCQSASPYATSFIYNDYLASPVTTVCESGGATASCPTAPPPSFYLAAKPAWWGSLSWPANGPDVTGGTGPAGHAYGNPAYACFKLMGGTDGGVGSPYAFNENTCYGTASAAARKRAREK